jgi:ABC-type nitrate/sulfonate/bicarbonate transport system substrate-binding protein
MSRLVAIMVLSLFAVLSAVCSDARAAEPIRIAYSSVNPHALLVWIAEKRGLYAKHGLSSTLVYVPGG